ncbi:MAG: glycosyltransferase family 2 protein [Pyrinomonadaceae bacterium]|nr:glycosyltransferase family 2 protein [Pyrinomonadaceae bacterium]
MAAEVSVGVCAILKNEADYVEEWLAFHMLQGVGRFILYDNNSSDDTCRRATSFAKHVDLQIIHWPDSAHGFECTQLLAYLDGARRLAGLADYVAFLDLDEFVFASDYRPLGQVLANFPADTAAIAVNQRLFGSAAQPSSTGDLVTSRFTRAAAPDHPEGHWFKTIARPDRIVGFDSAHMVALNSGAYVLSDARPLPRPQYPGHSSIVAEGALRLHHYMLKSRQEFELKKLRWSGQDLRDRYTDAYFNLRDISINAVCDERLQPFASRIHEMMRRARADGMWPSATLRREGVQRQLDGKDQRHKSF